MESSAFWSNFSGVLMNQTPPPRSFFFFFISSATVGMCAAFLVQRNWPSTFATDGRHRTSEQKFWCLPVPPNDCETAPDSEEETELRLVFALTGSGLHACGVFFLFQNLLPTAASTLLTRRGTAGPKLSESSRSSRIKGAILCF